MSRPTRVALGLGGGGARGYAHIGVIQVLEERGYEIVDIAGSSMGAVIGGLHAAGGLEAYTAWVRPLTQRDVLRLLDPSIRSPGLIRGEKVLAKVSEILDGAVIEDLPIGFTAVATDLLAGKEVWFQSGRVDVAIRASMALPSFITPVMLNGRLLADGGLLNPVPIVATAASSADLTVAVSLSEDQPTSTASAWSDADHVPIAEDDPSLAEGDPSLAEGDPSLAEDALERTRRTAAHRQDRELMRTFTSWLSSVRGSSPAVHEAAPLVDDDPFGALPPGMRTLDVMQLSLEALQRSIKRYRLAGFPPDVLITIPKGACRTLDFHRAAEMIALGREEASKALDAAV